MARRKLLSAWLSARRLVCSSRLDCQLFCRLSTLNADPRRGCACLVERRLLETLEDGAPRTPYLRHGDRVRIEMLDDEGRSIFGAIDQEVRIGP